MTVPPAIAPQVLAAASQELGTPAGATQAQQITAVEAWLRAQLKGLVRKRLVDIGRRDGEAAAQAAMPDLDSIT